MFRVSFVCACVLAIVFSALDNCQAQRPAQERAGKLEPGRKLFLGGFVLSWETKDAAKVSVTFHPSAKTQTETLAMASVSEPELAKVENPATLPYRDIGKLPITGGLPMGQVKAFKLGSQYLVFKPTAANGVLDYECKYWASIQLEAPPPVPPPPDVNPAQPEQNVLIRGARFFALTKNESLNVGNFVINWRAEWQLNGELGQAYAIAKAKAASKPEDYVKSANFNETTANIPKLDSKQGPVPIGAPFFTDKYEAQVPPQAPSTQMMIPGGTLSCFKSGSEYLMIFCRQVEKTRLVGEYVYYKKGMPLPGCIFTPADEKK